MAGIKIEIACFNLQSALIAEHAGADRIELCENYEAGGITPSYQVIEEAKKNISVPVFVMIRPRAGNFIYSDDEFEQVGKDIQFCKKLGMDGVVLGLLNPDGSIDTSRTKKLVELAAPMPVTFHRAFDVSDHPFDAMEDLITCGCKRILTSGHSETAIGGKELITQLIRQANGKIIILPGGGVRSGNIPELLKTGAREFHSSAINKETWLADELEIRKIKRELAGR
ncbi:MAG: copper homeostasis protein CutC [Bacteroidetes bacterium]|nr:copper homeostasis protein CutC [Bacteroidota bacterium]